MKQLHGNSLVFATTTMMVLMAQPVWAQTTKITEVSLNPVDDGINIVLKTSEGNRPQIFTTKRGKALVADIINTQLQLRQGDSFREESPVAGIAKVEVFQLDANSVRVVVMGTNDAPNNQPVERKDNRLTLAFTPTNTTQANITSPKPTAQLPTPSPATGPSQPTAAPEVLVPNPQVSIDGKPAPLAEVSQPPTPAPPFLPRAVAPPVGDIAIANVDASPTTIDLGTLERVPRLVLRDAPVREVLSLLARAAGLNLAYAGNSATAVNGAPGQPGGGSDGPTISLDIENEPVQDVFNYVLRLSGLEANRSGRTIFVGPKLPNSTRDVVMRNLRLNQVTVGVALNFLVGLGAESAVSRERQVTSVSAVPLGNGANPLTQTQTTTETRLETQRVEFRDSSPLLRGLQALGDERTNSITLIGPPRLVDMAMSQLTQLDVRRRQVAVNVRIIDVNLLGTQDINTSFSFGVGNNFFVNDGGAAAFNFGGSRPATRAEAVTSVTSTPTIGNPITGAPFFEQNSTFTVPNGGSGLRIIEDGFLVDQTSGNATFLQPIPPFGQGGDPTRPGLSNFTPGTPDTVTITTDPATGRQTAAFAQGTRATATFSLPTLFQFPRRFLLSLQAQVQNGNAKILTDPTLIVQEGQTASVNLTQEVIGNIRSELTRGDDASVQTVTAEKTNVGLTLAVKIERIDDNGFVSLSVAPNIKAPQAPAEINFGIGTQRIILVSERSLQSGLIRLRDGQTLVLSGIIQDADRTTVSKLPILGDIPLLGSLFRRMNRENQRSEVIVLLTPQIIDDAQGSPFGYNYTPSPDVRQILERRGLQVPKR